MPILSHDDDHVLAAEGPLVVSLYRRPYQLADVLAMERAFDNLIETYGRKSASLIIVDTRTWTREVLPILKNEETRAALIRLQGKYGDDSWAATAIALIGSGVIVSMVRSLATGLSLIQRSGNRKYFGDADAAVRWLTTQTNADPARIMASVSSLARWAA